MPLSFLVIIIASPHLPGLTNLGKPVDRGRLGSYWDVIPRWFPSVIASSEARKQSLCGPDKARLKAKMRCNEDIAEET